MTEQEIVSTAPEAAVMITAQAKRIRELEAQVADDGRQYAHLKAVWTSDYNEMKSKLIARIKGLDCALAKDDALHQDAHEERKVLEERIKELEAQLATGMGTTQMLMTLNSENRMLGKKLMRAEAKNAKLREALDDVLTEHCTSVADTPIPGHPYIWTCHCQACQNADKALASDAGKEVLAKVEELEAENAKLRVQIAGMKAIIAGIAESLDTSYLHRDDPLVRHAVGLLKAIQYADKEE